MKKILSHWTNNQTLFIVLGLIIAGFLFGYGRYQNDHLNERLMASLNEVNQRLASTTDELRIEINGLRGNLAVTESERIKLTEVLQSEQERTNSVQQGLQEISGTVGTLQKLSKTDPELLQKYSKTFFLNEHYAPPRLVEINAVYLAKQDKPQQIHASVWPYLEKLLQAAKNENQNLQIVSGFRSFNTQSALKSNYKVTYGAGTANQFSADQGYSEHQLGTTVDFNTLEMKIELAGFDQTVAYNWLLKNAYRYGFVISYPKENVYYQFEPWHWRFVGVALATKLHNDNKFFYNLDQREIDEYLVKIFD